MGKLVGRAKSSVHRHLRARERRNRHPESGLWETEAGSAWLRLLVFAALYSFGLRHHVGADALSDFFKLLRIDSHAGVSPGALRTQLRRMEALLPAFQRDCEASAPAGPRKAVLAADETFFGEVLILVLMDLSSGYLLLESIRDDRGFETWFAGASPRLEALGIRPGHAVSDRAKALIKLAVEGFGCASGADTFHELHGLCRWLSPALGRRKARADQRREEARKALASGAGTDAAKAILAAQQAGAMEACAQVDAALKDCQETLLGLSGELHPFSLEDNTRRSVEQVVAGLEARAGALEAIAARQGIPDTRSALRKFRAQKAALASHIGFWWLWVEEILLGWPVDAPTRQWLTAKLLPALYWRHQMDKTRNRVHRERYRKAWRKAVRAYEADPFRSALSDGDLQRWLEWGEWMVRQFHRSSSAVEGRNGCLSQMHHNGRGLTESRLAALTVIHNYGLRRADGSTAAERLFGAPFPDLFGWLVGQMGELPMPRKARQRIVRNPLKLEPVPA